MNFGKLKIPYRTRQKNGEKKAAREKKKDTVGRISRGGESHKAFLARLKGGEKQKSSRSLARSMVSIE